MQERHKALGCTLIVTQNHLITLREDFSAPLRQLNKQADAAVTTPAAPEPKQIYREDEMLSIFETSSLVSYTYPALSLLCFNIFLIYIAKFHDEYSNAWHTAFLFLDQLNAH